MAKANSTPSLVREDPDSAADPTTINPLIHEDRDDTICAVNDVLAFLSGAMELAERSSEMPLDRSCAGFSWVLDTCRAALAYRHGQKGGAA